MAPIQKQCKSGDLIAATGLVMSNWIQIVDFSACVVVKFDGWPRKTIGHFLYIQSNPSVKSNLSYSPETLNLGQNWNSMDDFEKQ